MNKSFIFVYSRIKGYKPFSSNSSSLLREFIKELSSLLISYDKPIYFFDNNLRFFYFNYFFLSGGFRTDFGMNYEAN
jgi:hypothetical protein